MIPDHEIYPVLCQASYILVLIFVYSASKLCNSLYPNLQYITNPYLFKKNVKTHLWKKLLAVDQDEYIFFLITVTNQIVFLYF